MALLTLVLSHVGSRQFQYFIFLVENQIHVLTLGRMSTGLGGADPSLAYIMTTSGTTGEPKPVRVPHAAITVNVLEVLKDYYLIFIQKFSKNPNHFY